MLRKATHRLRSSEFQRLAGVLPGPLWPVRSGNLKILTAEGPEAFHKELLERIRTAERRVLLSALYLGEGGPTEEAFLDTVQAARLQNPEVDFEFLFDRWRGARPRGGSVVGLRRALQLSSSSDSSSSSSSSSSVSSLPTAPGDGETPVSSSSTVNGNLKLNLFRIPTLHSWFPGPVAEFLNQKLFRRSPISLEQDLLRRLETSKFGTTNFFRLREFFGVHHLKLGVFDDTILLTGANLSESYFTNRTDRYILVENEPELADRLTEFLQLLGKSDFSRKYRLPPSSSSEHREAALEEGQKHSPSSAETSHRTKAVSFIEDGFEVFPEARISETKPLEFGKEIQKTLFAPSNSAAAAAGATERDGECLTFISLLPQFSGFGVQTDVEITAEILRLDWRHPQNDEPSPTPTTPGKKKQEDRPSSDALQFSLSSPYLNINPEIQKALQRMRDNLMESHDPDSAVRKMKGESSMQILTGSRRANGFHGASGPLGIVPALFERAAEKLQNNLEFRDGRQTDRNVKLKLDLWDRENWTFHSKGIWLERLRQTDPDPNPLIRDGESSTAEDTVGSSTDDASEEWMLNLVGSSNFGYRSAYLDSELQFAILTRDPEVIQAFRAEREDLWSRCLEQDSTAAPGQEKQTNWIAKMLFPIFKYFM